MEALPVDTIFVSVFANANIVNRGKITDTLQRCTETFQPTHYK